MKNITIGPNDNQVGAYYICCFIELDKMDTKLSDHAHVDLCATSSPSRLRCDTSQSSTDDQAVYISIEARDKDSSFAVNGIAGDVYRDVIDAPVRQAH